MKENQDIRAESEVRLKISTEKIKALKELLTKEPSQQTETSRPEVDSDFLSTSELAARLFEKASTEFLERKTLADLALITEKAAAHLSEFLHTEPGILIATDNPTDYSAIYILLGDHPFIISSVTECLRDFGVTILSFTHPIIVEDGYRISLSYVEISSLSDEQLSVLVRRIQQVLRHVILSTDDFTAMLVRAETLARVLNSTRYPSPVPAIDRKEIASFMRWLTDGGLIFLGHVEWRIEQDDSFNREPTTELGVFRAEGTYSDPLCEEILQDNEFLVDHQEPVVVTKLRANSLVHRRSRLIHIGLQEHSADGKLFALHSFVGLLTSRALSQESSSVPLIRQKLQRLLKTEHAIENSHDYKNIVSIVDSMPKDEVLRLDIESLRGIVHTILGVQNRNETRVSVRFDRAKRGASILIVMPRDRFNTQVRHKLQAHIEKVFGASHGSSEYYLDLSSKPHARFYFHITLPEESAAPVDVARLKLDIAGLTRTWRDNLEELISSSKHFEDNSSVWYRYSDAFGDEYQALHSVQECEVDIQYLERLTAENPIAIAMSAAPEGGLDAVSLTVYHSGSEITISRALPILENAGVEVINERSSTVTPSGKPLIYLHRFLVRLKDDASVDGVTFAETVAPGLVEIFSATAKNDRLNSLMLSAGLSVQSISVLRAYCGLLWQVNKFATRSSILNTLASTPSMAAQLWNMFEIRFNPNLQSSIESRNERFKVAVNKYHDGLREVSDITKDRILRSLLSLLKHTVRTNFYLGTPTLTLKIHSEKVEIMPNPRPMYECYVCSQTMEGTHLRSSLIARGGLRWSDRHEDFRSEVLGLMKTQKVKNALIVPDGAKGGFVVKNLPADSKEAWFSVESAYKDFIRALLSIADNRVNGDIVHPDKVVIYDGDDPYLVVAADKGTATFSDTANKIAVEEYDFWLQDAFASGGSNGYDHKVYGITARGAWESVKRHFKNLQIDIEECAFSTVGIGDMSGDVFGNGMLLSDKVKLIAAFNHKHVFIDPNPDPAVSFQERKRLFETPGSQWSDYSPALIAPGGGVFGRFDKEITISPEIRSALSLSEEVPEVLNGEQLISHILRSKVDLFWNGGIGTYVKSKAESNVDVNDGTNDRVRVNAHELRAKIVGEGGNLGFTQLARIEFARNGFCIHTDAIDNSGGVDLSDHEVNLKILFALLMKQDMLTFEDRNQLLLDVADEVVELVLNNNRAHAMLLTLGLRRSKKHIEYFHSLIREITKLGYIDRNLEYLPSDDELVERASKKQGLCKPELAICLAAVKLWIKDILLDSDLLEEPLLETFLYDYFPTRVKEGYRESIAQHPLKRNIIATEATNCIVNAAGITFIHRMRLAHFASPTDVVKSTLAAEILLDARVIKQELSEKFDTYQRSETYLKLYSEVDEALREAAAWLLSYHGTSCSLGEMVDLYKDSFRTLILGAADVLVGQEREISHLRSERYSQLGLTADVVNYLSAFPRVISILEMIWTSRESKKPVEKVAHLFSLLRQELHVHPLLTMESSIEPRDKWEHELAVNSYEEIRRSLSKIAMRLLKMELKGDEALAGRIRGSASYQPLLSTIAEVREKVPPVAALSVIARQLRNYQL